MSTDLATTLEAAAASPQEKTIRDLIARQAPAIERLIGKQTERFLRVVETEMRRTPGLYDCEPHSLLGALMLAAQLDLEPGPLGHVYLVPFKREVQFIVGYKGMIELAYRSGKVKEVVARRVWENEPFSGLLSDERGDHFKHSQLPPAERGANAKAWWARARTTTGGLILSVIYPEDAEAARKRSAAGSKDKGPWSTDYDAMARKTAVRRLSAFLPQSPQFAQALAVDETAAPAFEESEGVDA